MNDLWSAACPRAVHPSCKPASWKQFYDWNQRYKGCRRKSATLVYDQKRAPNPVRIVQTVPDGSAKTGDLQCRSRSCEIDVLQNPYRIGFRVWSLPGVGLLANPGLCCPVPSGQTDMCRGASGLPAKTLNGERRGWPPRVSFSRWFGAVCLPDRPTATCPSSPASPRCRTPASRPQPQRRLSL